jgi:hypothetical protein
LRLGEAEESRGLACDLVLMLFLSTIFFQKFAIIGEIIFIVLLIEVNFIISFVSLSGVEEI